MEDKDEYINSLLLGLLLMQGEIDRLNQTLDLARKGELVYINNPQIAELKAEVEKLREDYIKLSQQKDLDNARWQKRCTDLHIEDKAKADKYWLVLQEIKAIAETASPYIDNFEIKTAIEIGYDYAAICNELELRLHKILELITKTEEE